MIKGTKMAFAYLKKDDDIANVLAYLKSFSEDVAAAPAAVATAPVETAEAAPAAEELGS